jgi:hypothetical protein
MPKPHGISPGMANWDAQPGAIQYGSNRILRSAHGAAGRRIAR